MYKTSFNWLNQSNIGLLMKIGHPCVILLSKHLGVAAKVTLNFVFEIRNCIVIKMDEIMIYTCDGSDFHVEDTHSSV